MMLRVCATVTEVIDLVNHCENKQGQGVIFLLTRNNKRVEGSYRRQLTVARPVAFGLRKCQQASYFTHKIMAKVRLLNDFGLVNLYSKGKNNKHVLGIIQKFTTMRK